MGTSLGYCQKAIKSATMHKLLKIGMKRLMLNKELYNALYWFALGNLEYKQNKFVKAQTSYEKAIELDPENAEYWYKLGCVQCEQEDFIGAWVSYEKAIALESQNAVKTAIIPQKFRLQNFCGICASKASSGRDCKGYVIR